MKASLKADLEAAFRDVLTRMSNGFTTQEAVDALRVEHSELWQESGDALVTELLRAIASRILRRPDATEVNPEQLALPGFEHLPRLIRCKGHYVAIEDSTLEQLQDFKGWYDTRLQVLLKRTEKFQQTGKEIARLIRLVERYTDQSPAITVKAVFALRENRKAQREARMRNLTPQERSEIARLARLGLNEKWRMDSEE